jgi:hypothetical protein
MAIEGKTAVQIFQERVVEMIDGGCHGFHFTPGPKWHGLPIEDKCEAILEMWDSRKALLDFKDSQRRPMTKEESGLMWKSLFESAEVIETLPIPDDAQ